MVMHTEYIESDIAEQLKLPRRERIKIVNSEHWIGYSRAQLGVSKLEELINCPRRVRMPNMLILSPTNNGKTMLVKSFMRRYPSTEKQDSNGYYIQKEMPVLYLQMPSSPDLKRFYTLIFHSLNLRTPPVSRIAEIETHALTLIANLKVRMLIIDELHNILAGRADSQREFLNLLRFLGNELQVPIVALGTKDAYLAIRSDDQLENRFEPFILPCWQYDREYLSLLASFSKVFPIKTPVDLTRPKLAKKILEMSDGKIGEISTIIKKAIIWCIPYAGNDNEISEVTFDVIDYKSPSERRKQIERELH